MTVDVSKLAPAPAAVAVPRVQTTSESHEDSSSVYLTADDEESDERYACTCRNDWACLMCRQR